MRNPLSVALAAGAALGLAGTALARPTYDYSGAPVVIPDSPGAAVTASIVVADSFTIGDISASLIVTHTWQGDLVFTLTHVETGHTITLVNRPDNPATTFGFSNDNYGNLATTTYFNVTDTGATKYDNPPVVAPGTNNVTGDWKPDSGGPTMIGTFGGENSAGTWRLSAQDFAGGDVGNIEKFRLTLSANTAPTGRCCLSNGNCSVVTASSCATQGGIYAGDNTQCGTCPQPSACCVADGCVVVLQAACTAQGGVYHDGQTCAQANCPGPTCVNLTGVGAAIADSATGGNAGPTTDVPIVFLGSGTISSLSAKLVITHTFHGDVRAQLVHPDATAIDLIARPGVAPPKYITGAGTGFGLDNYGNPATGTPMVFKDSAAGVFDSAVGFPGPPAGAATDVDNITGDWKPGDGQVLATVFGGKPSAGTWHLIVNDYWPVDVGTVNAVSLCIQNVAAPTCYPNCNHSTDIPCLNIQDFSCFLNAFSNGDTYANCNGSTDIPVLNIQDFSCFLNSFSNGCSSC